MFIYLLVLKIFWKYSLENIAYVIFCADIARLLQYFNNVSDRFRNILAILQYFQGIFLQYFLNISVLCGTYRAISKFLKSKRGECGRYLWHHFYRARKGSTLLRQYVGEGARGSKKVKSMVKSLMDSPFANRFDRLSRNFLNVVRSLFAKTYPNFVNFDGIFKTKKKKFRRLEKNLKKFLCILTNWQINFGPKS